ncbi:MAG: hypothetical protein LBV67_03355 [Streptococcaceae bacterium]|jgi:hypothetical protein|nr:hypothetical protein [Streptococcaceae bacterium]
MRDFNIEINELIIGKIKEIKVNKEEFMAFRQSWLISDEKENIIGKAEFGGNIVYFHKKTKE